MFKRSKIVGVLYMVLSLGAMLFLWQSWVPKNDVETLVWWVIFVILGYFVLKGLIVIVFLSATRWLYRRILRR